MLRIGFDQVNLIKGDTPSIMVTLVPKIARARPDLPAPALTFRAIRMCRNS